MHTSFEMSLKYSDSHYNKTVTTGFLTSSSPNSIKF